MIDYLTNINSHSEYSIFAIVGVPHEIVGVSCDMQLNPFSFSPKNVRCYCKNPHFTVIPNFYKLLIALSIIQKSAIANHHYSSFFSKVYFPFQLPAYFPNSKK